MAVIQTSGNSNHGKEKNAAERVQEKWSKDLSQAESFSTNLFWLAIPEVKRRTESKAVRGTAYPTWVDYFLNTYFADKLPLERMASIGCGDGSLERQLAALGAFKVCDAFDIAPDAIQTARQLAKEAGIKPIQYEVEDMNSYRWKQQYDVVWFNGSFHHIEKLEFVCEQIARSLKPGGYLFLNEYIGPSRFKFTPRQIEIMQAAFRLIPQHYRRSFIPNYPHFYQQEVQIPDPKEVATVDPSEAVRSEEIMNVVRKYFEVVEYNPMGGTILHFLLSGIAGNFETQDPDSIKVLEMLFQMEDTLMEIGDIQSDFVCVAAKVK